jgi:hypothetical protein
MEKILISKRFPMLGILLVFPYSTFAQQPQELVGVAGIVLDSSVDSVPRNLAFKCHTSLSAIDAPTSKDPALRLLQADLQRAKARGTSTCFATRKPEIGRLRTESVMVTSEYGHIHGIYLSFFPEEGTSGIYNAGARDYIIDLTEKRYGPGVGASRKTSWQRWSPIKYEHSWLLPAAKIEVVDEPRRLLQMSFISATRFTPSAEARVEIAKIEKKIAERERQIIDRKQKAANKSERDLFPK